MIPDRLLKDRATIKRPTQRKSGREIKEPTLTTIATDVPCKIDQQRMNVLTAVLGNVSTSSWTMFMRPSDSYVVKPNDEVTDQNSTRYCVKSVNTFHGHHWEVTMELVRA